MKKTILILLFSMALLSLNACNDTKKENTPSAKCEAGKCSSDMQKKTTEKKCSSDSKCGEGKCNS